MAQPAQDIGSAPRLYVPYRDLAAAIDPAARTVLMERAEFQKLLAAAKTATGIRAAQVVRADYTGEIKGSTLSLAGELTLTSLYDGVAAAPLNFAQLGLTEVTLDGKPAPLGYDSSAQLVVLVGAKGDHKLSIKATASLNDLPSGGMQWGVVLPKAVAGTLKFSASGDLAVHATVPVAARTYDKQADRMDAELAIGGQGAITVVLLGNGRQDDDRAILLGESTTAVSIEKSLQTLNCLYSVQVLRRGVTALTFELPAGWTVTDVASPNLLRWDVANAPSSQPAATGPAVQRLTVKLANAGRGTQLLSIQATRAAEAPAKWSNPFVRLQNAAFQRGFLMVDTGQQLRVRSESFVDARREDSSAARAVTNNPAMLDLAQRLYYHWGDASAVGLDLAAVTLRRSTQERQDIGITSKELLLQGLFQVTAIDRPMYSMEFDLPAAAAGWELTDVLVNGQAGGFEYRLGEPNASPRRLTVELAQPVPPEGAANVTLHLRQVPRDWDWSAPSDQTKARDVAVPLLKMQADTVSGVVTVSAQQDLQTAAEANLPAGLTEISVGKMASLGIAAARAYSYETPMGGVLTLKVSRQQPRVSADAVGVVTADAKNVTGVFLFNYNVTRGSTRRLELLTDKSLGETFRTEPAGRRLAGRQKIASDKTPAGYDLWELTLDAEASGLVQVLVSYVQPLPAGQFAVPLVRPMAQQTSEHLAVQASEELAVNISATGASEIDAVELPALPVPARRILAAYRLSPLGEGAASAVSMSTKTHEGYAIPPTLASSARLTTLLGPNGEQQTVAVFDVANAGMQFLKIRLPQGAQLWSLSIGGVQAKPKRDADGDYLLPIGRTSHRVPVRLIYAWEPNAAGRCEVALGGVTLVGVNINESKWTVIPPPGYCVTSQQSYMETRDLQPAAVAAVKTIFAMGRATGSMSPVYMAKSRTVSMNWRVSAPSNLHQVGKAIEAYRAAHQGQYPDTLDRLVDEKLIASPELLDMNGSRFSYHPPAPGAKAPADTIIADSSTFDDMKVVLKSDATVEVRETDKGRKIRVADTAVMDEDDNFGMENESAEDLTPDGIHLPGAEGLKHRELARLTKHLKSDLYFDSNAAEVAALKEQVEILKRENPSPAERNMETDRTLVKVGAGTLDRNGVTGVAMGRYTLPLELSAGGMGPAVVFTGLGEPALTVSISPQRDVTRWGMLSFVLMGVVGLAALRATGRRQWLLVLVAMTAATLAGLWFPSITSLANGVFFAAMAILPVYIIVQICRWVRRRRAATMAKAIAVALLLAFALAPSAAYAGGAPDAMPAGKGGMEKPSGPAAPAASPVGLELPLVFPYDPNTGPDASDKVLLSHAQYLRLWAQAHPESIAENLPASASLADVKYTAVLEGEKMTIVLTADLQTSGKGNAVLPMPFTGLAVVEATVAGQPARLQSGPGGMVLAVEAPASGALKITAAANPALQGRKGSMNFTLPMLPAAVMTVLLPQDDLVLEAPGIEGALTSAKTPAGMLWTLPLGGARNIALRWLPKSGSGLTDRTLSAAAAHDVQVFHWAMVGVSKFSYTFSAADYDRFELLLPSELTLTDLSGANLRDYRVVDERMVDGRKMRLVEARLYRAVGAGEDIKGERRYELTARWLCPLPALDKNVPLPLPRAEGAGRESGTVDLRAAGGMNVKVVDALGGRRSSVAATAAANAGATSLVAQYYWPYRPFELTVELSRQTAVVKAKLDQLLRLTPDSAQLLVKADLSATQGLLFDAGFELPAGYELLSAIGPAVADHYLQPAGAGKRLHVNFRSGVSQTALSLVLVKAQPQLGTMEIPTVSAIDANGVPLPQQSGRLAVQPAAALDTRTVSSENLKPVPPSALAGWLEDAQQQAVRFAYQYDRGPIALSLEVKKQPTRVRAQVLAALNVQPTAAWYTYRIRYTIEGSPVDRVSFTMPQKYVELAAVTCPSLRDVTQTPLEGGTKWTVLLSTELTGVLDVVVNFALPLPRQEQGAKTPLELPRLAVEAPEGYQAVVAVQNYSGQDLVPAAKGLGEVSAGEQVRLLESKALPYLQYVGQAFKDDWSLSLELTAVKAAQRIQAVVDLLTVTTTIDRAGNSRYEAIVELQNRSEQFLRVQSPPSLSLWSASVAGEPVRPVVAKDRPGEILIPLVKTSPGGLPYEVRMYFAGGGLGRISGMTELRPPAIRIVGVPVVRTLWSLRLPGGYDYIRPGGNVSPIAGESEALAIALDAKLDQFKRLGQVAEETGNDYNERRLATQNLKEFNYSLNKEISQLKSNLAANQDKLKGEEYRRLEGKIAQQRLTQETLVTSTEHRFLEEAKATSENLNGRINSLLLNGGTMEVDRNEALTVLPQFVKQAAAEQVTELNADIAKYKDASEKVAEQSKMPAKVSKTGKGKVTASDSEKIGDLGELTLEEDRDAQAGDVLKSLQEQQITQAGERQKELKSQLDQLSNSRMERYYNNPGANQKVGQVVSSPASTSALVPGIVSRPAGTSAQVPQGGVNSLSLTNSNSAQPSVQANQGYGNFVTNDQSGPNPARLGTNDAWGNQPVGNLSNVNTYSGGQVNAGGLVLAGNNSYAGNTIINGGTLTLRDSGAMIGDHAVVNNGDLDLNGVNGVNLARNGSGTLFINGTQAYGSRAVQAPAGGLVVSSGQLTVGDSTANGARVTINDGGTLNLGGQSQTTGFASAGGAARVQPNAETNGSVTLSSGNSTITVAGNGGSVGGLVQPNVMTNGVVGGWATESGFVTFNGNAASSARGGRVNDAANSTIRGGLVTLDAAQPASQPAEGQLAPWYEIQRNPRDWREIAADRERHAKDDVAYVAKSTFSLPVSLPEGQVRLDFVRMGGDAEVTVLAVPTRWINNLYATGTILVLLGILGGLWRLIGGRKKPGATVLVV